MANVPPAGPVVPRRNVPPAENHEFFNKYLSMTEAYDNLILNNVGVYPFTETWTGTHAPTMAYIIYYVHLYENNRRPDRDTVLTLVYADFLAPFLPQAKFLAQAEAQAAVIAVARRLIREEQLRNGLVPLLERNAYLLEIPEAGRNLFTEHAVELLGEPEADDWPDFQAHPNAEINIHGAMRFLFYASMSILQANQVNGLEMLINVGVAIAKRGIISDQFRTKIENGVMTDLGKPVTVNSNAIMLFYKFFGTGIDQNTIQDFKQRWEALIPDAALRLRLTIQQLVGSGLTAFVTIGRAMKHCQDFPWDICTRLYPIDVTNYHAANAEVRGNMFYGFKHNLGPVRSTLYPNLAWVAKELLLRQGMSPSLRNYRGWKSTVPERGAIDAIIDEYIARKTEERAAANVPPRPNPQGGYLHQLPLTQTLVAIGTAQYNADIFA